uniref:Uncharacterized protein n=1 Tax=Anopheles albimanus TaxID=7167 RepID=A0A182FCK8_ANOAL
MTTTATEPTQISASEVNLFFPFMTTWCQWQLVLTGQPRHCDDVGDVTEDGREQHQPEQQLSDHEHVLGLRAGPRQIADCGEGERAPVVALQVLLHHVRRLRVVEDPVLRAETIVLIDNVVEAAVPVEDDEQIVDERGRAEQVRVVGVPLRPIHERPEPVDLDEPERAQDRVEADREVQEVERQQTQAVDVEGGRVHVVLPELGRVRLQHTVLEVAGPEVEQYVDEVQEVGEVVKAEPHHDRLAVDLLEREPIDDDPEVVQERHRHHHRPVVAEAAGRIEHERPPAAIRFARRAEQRLVARFQLAPLALPVLARQIHLRGGGRHMGVQGAGGGGGGSADGREAVARREEPLLRYALAELRPGHA